MSANSTNPSASKRNRAPLRNILAATAIAAATLGAQSARAEETKPATITITGEGRVSVVPDLAILNLGVTRQAKTAREALDRNNAAMASVITAMKETGIEGKDLQTANFSIQPNYKHYAPKKGEEHKPPKIVSYTVSNNLTVRIRDLSRVGEVLDESVTLGVNTGGGIRFTNDDPGDEIKSARAAAMRDAMERANTLLEAAGASMGRILSINENTHTPRPTPVAHARMMAAEAADAVPVEAGENTYRVNVTVSWEIKQ